MVDTLKLKVDDHFRLSKSAQVEVEPGSEIYANGEKHVVEHRLFQWENGDWQWGRRAYLNKDGLHLTLLPRFNEYQKYTCKLTLQINPAKFVYGNNLQPVNAEQFSELWHQLPEQLGRLGYEADWRNSDLMRLDIGVNLETEQPESKYLEILSSLPVRRSMRRRYYTDHQNDTEGVLMRNRNHQFAFYNKRYETYKTARQRSRNPFTVRLEKRSMNAKTTAKQFEVTKLSEIIEKYRAVCETGLSDIKNMFSGEFKPVAVNTERIDDLKAIFFYHHETRSRYWQQAALRDIAYYALSQSLTKSQLSEMLREMGVTGGNLTKIRREFDQAVFEKKVHKQGLDLYFEIKEKISACSVE